MLRNSFPVSFPQRCFYILIVSHTSQLWHQSSVAERKKYIAKLCGHQVLPNPLLCSYSSLWVWGFHDSKYADTQCQSDINGKNCLVWFQRDLWASPSTADSAHRINVTFFPPLQCQTTLSWGCWQNAWTPSTAWPMAGCSLASPGTWGRESSCRKHRLIPTGKGQIQPSQPCGCDKFVCGKIQTFIDVVYAAAS